MHNRPTLRQPHALDDLVVVGKRGGLGFLVPEGAEEVEEVARVEQRGVAREAARHVPVADDPDPVPDHHLARDRARWSKVIAEAKIRFEQ